MQQVMLEIKLWQVLAYSGIALTVVQMWMKTMIPLRLLAITTNVLFLGYSILDEVWVTLILNCILLPLNVYRLQEMRTLIRKVEYARGAEVDMTWLRPFMSRHHVNAGEILFRKGD